MIGVIPACAGNRVGNHPTPSRKPGHPCVCGEQSRTSERMRAMGGSSLRVRGTDLRYNILLHATISAGSSLRVRGTVDIIVMEAAGWWVIPACAGNRWVFEDGDGAETGHPCVCGEQTGAEAAADGWVGSSLRVRGTDSVIWCAIESSCQIQPL